jgi:hypothetical protein
MKRKIRNKRALNVWCALYFSPRTLLSLFEREAFLFLCIGMVFGALAIVTIIELVAY